MIVLHVFSVMVSIIGFVSFWQSLSSEESSIDTARIMKFLDPKKNKKPNDNTWWMQHVEEEDEDCGKTTNKYITRHTEEKQESIT